MTIDELSLKYGSDMTPKYGHSYSHKFDELFSKMKNVEKVLEIGIGYPELMEKYVPGYNVGPSLKVWRDYFPNAQIYGVDNMEVCMFEDERITTILCDQSNSRELEAIASKFGPFDIIIDDGSHEINHQILSAEVLLPHVKNGGLYIIEDIINAKKLLEKFGDKNIELFDFNLGGGQGNDDKLFIIKC